MRCLCSALLGGGPACPSVCGAMTSGGTESILSAMKVRPWGGENVAGLIFVRLQAPATCVAGSVYVV